MNDLEKRSGYPPTPKIPDPYPVGPKLPDPKEDKKMPESEESK